MYIVFTLHVKKKQNKGNHLRFQQVCKIPPAVSSKDVEIWDGFLCFLLHKHFSKQSICFYYTCTVHKSMIRIVGYMYVPSLIMTTIVCTCMRHLERVASKCSWHILRPPGCHRVFNQAWRGVAKPYKHIIIHTVHTIYMYMCLYVYTCIQTISTTYTYVMATIRTCNYLLFSLVCINSMTNSH